MLQPQRDKAPPEADELARIVEDRNWDPKKATVALTRRFWLEAETAQRALESTAAAAKRLSDLRARVGNALGGGARLLQDRARLAEAIRARQLRSGAVPPGVPSPPVATEYDAVTAAAERLCEYEVLQVKMVTPIATALPQPLPEIVRRMNASIRSVRRATTAWTIGIGGSWVWEILEVLIAVVIGLRIEPWMGSFGIAEWLVIPIVYAIEKVTVGAWVEVRSASWKWSIARQVLAEIRGQLELARLVSSQGLTSPAARTLLESAEQCVSEYEADHADRVKALARLIEHVEGR